MKLQLEDDNKNLQGMTDVDETKEDFNRALDAINDEDPLSDQPDKALTYNLDADSEIGDEYNKTGSGVDYVKPIDGQVLRFAFPKGSGVAADFVHYSANVGYVRCNSPRNKGAITKKCLCCTTLPEAKPRRAVSVFIYDATYPKSGKLGKGEVSVTCKILRASAALWKSISQVIDEDSNHYSYDFLLGKNPNEKAFSVGVASRKAPQWLVHEAEAMESLQNSQRKQNGSGEGTRQEPHRP